MMCGMAICMLRILIVYEKATNLKQIFTEYAKIQYTCHIPFVNGKAIYMYHKVNIHKHYLYVTNANCVYKENMYVSHNDCLWYH